jgi:hypothetical protein
MKTTENIDFRHELSTEEGEDEVTSVNETGNISIQAEPDQIAAITNVERQECSAGDREEEIGTSSESNVSASLPSPANGHVRLYVRPCELKQANELVARWHRHHKPVQGHRFSLRAEDQHAVDHGAAIIGRPVARNNPQREWVEVIRLVTDGTPNACSLLYAAAARAAKAMGYEKIITYTLENEDGASLRAAGWTYEGLAGGGDWNVPSRGGRRVDQPMGPKKRWSKLLRGRE